MFCLYFIDFYKEIRPDSTRPPLHSPAPLGKHIVAFSGYVNFSTSLGRVCVRMERIEWGQGSPKLHGTRTNSQPRVC